MSKNAYLTLVSVVKKKFKKKSRRWKEDLEELSSFKDAYEMAESFMNNLYDEFSDEEKEKYKFYLLKIGVTPSDGVYTIEVSYN